jgi:hypothetical protein
MTNIPKKDDAFLMSAVWWMNIRKNPDNALATCSLQFINLLPVISANEVNES